MSCYSFLNSSFNSRTREGCDTDNRDVKLGNVNVSIHAPGRGATGSYQRSTIYKLLFQFTHPGGVRQINVDKSTTDLQFQFTHPGGVRPGLSRLIIHFIPVSIHAPGRGATVWCKVAYYGADKQA